MELFMFITWLQQSYNQSFEEVLTVRLHYKGRGNPKQKSQLNQL